MISNSDLLSSTALYSSAHRRAHHYNLIMKKHKAVNYYCILSFRRYSLFFQMLALRERSESFTLHCSFASLLCLHCRVSVLFYMREVAHNYDSVKHMLIAVANDRKTLTLHSLFVYIKLLLLALLFHSLVLIHMLKCNKYI